MIEKPIEENNIDNYRILFANAMAVKVRTDYALAG